MADKLAADDDKAQDSSTEEDVMETCRKNMEACRQTLSKFDDLDRRWKVRERE